MSRFASGAILGFLLGAFLIIVLASDSQEGMATTHFKLPLKVEIEFGDSAATVAGQPVEAQTTAAPVHSAQSTAAALPPDFQDIIEYRRQCGSALAGTMLDINCPDDAEAEFVAGLTASASSDTGQEPSAAIAPVSAPPAIAPPLEQAIADLYRQADQCELSCEFERADRFRRLAREIRGAITEAEPSNEPSDEPSATTADARNADDGYPLD
jgi:hypothetical protein